MGTFNPQRLLYVLLIAASLGSNAFLDRGRCDIRHKLLQWRLFHVVLANAESDSRCILSCLHRYSAFRAESPRWLVYQGWREEARRVVALTCSNGVENDPIAEAEYKEIVDTIEWENSSG